MSNEENAMTTKHTPGPWRWLGNGGALVGDHGKRPVVLCGLRDRDGIGAGLGERDNETGLLRPIDPDGPNGRLLASAPALLDIVKRFVECADADIPPTKHGELYDDAVRAVIDARGGA